MRSFPDPRVRWETVARRGAVASDEEPSAGEAIRPSEATAEGGRLPGAER